jgi:hypothetical protein
VGGITAGGYPDQSKGGVDSNVVGPGFNEFAEPGVAGCPNAATFVGTTKVGVSIGRSSGTTFGSLYTTAGTWGGALAAPVLGQAGTATNTTGWYGDYFAAAPSPARPTSSGRPVRTAERPAARSSGTPRRAGQGFVVAQTASKDGGAATPIDGRVDKEAGGTARARRKP